MNNELNVLSCEEAELQGAPCLEQSQWMNFVCTLFVFTFVHKSQSFNQPLGDNHL